MNVLQLFLQEQERPRVQIVCSNDLHITIERLNYTGLFVVCLVKDNNVVLYEQHRELAPFFKRYGDIINNSSVKTYFTMDALNADYQEHKMNVRVGQKRFVDDTCESNHRKRSK